MLPNSTNYMSNVTLWKTYTKKVTTGATYQNTVSTFQNISMYKDHNAKPKIMVIFGNSSYESVNETYRILLSLALWMGLSMGSH